MFRSLVPMFLLVAGLAQAQEKPQDYIIKRIFFGGGSYHIDDAQLAELHQLIDSIPNIERYTITIHSHTDNIGGVEYNAWLSRKRSEAVIDQLLLRELRPEDISVRDFGQLNPVYDNDTWEGRIMNRRVDIIFWPMTL
jgi:outer membrane protein OmpA-like peptidoglycan-associated protein